MIFESQEDRCRRLPAIVRDRLQRNRRVRRALPGGGRLHVDRPLPFLCVHRWHAGARATGLERLATTQASYLIAPDEPVMEDLLVALTEAVATAGERGWKDFLVVELCDWPRPREECDLLRPELGLWHSDGNSISAPVAAIAGALRGAEVQGEPVSVSVAPEPPWPGGDWLRSSRPFAGGTVQWIGIGIVPVHRGRSGEIFPEVLLDLEEAVADALLAGFFELARRSTGAPPTHHHQLGRRAIVWNAWKVDRHLARVADSFEFLRLVTPWNAEEAWQEFRDRGYRRAPRFRYHPLPIDPEALKRTLYGTPIEKVEDITLARLYRERQEELDHQITMLRHRGTEEFLWGSLQLYGGVEDELRDEALALLARLPAGETRGDGRGIVSAHGLAERARRDIAVYRGRWPPFAAETEMRDDIIAGVMVSQGRLLVSRTLSVPQRRVDALLQHEVGTHLLTYFNGRAQRLRLFYVGLAGYEAFQEGLAVLAEYLVGGLDRWRLRLLAGRVLACRALVEGASLEEIFDQLTRRYGFEARTAFTIAARVQRGGGLTKDAIYLRGLREALQRISTREDPRLLFAGKIAGSHIPAVEELRHRGMLTPVPLLPLYFERNEVQQRLARLRRARGLGLAELAAATEQEAVA